MEDLHQDLATELAGVWDSKVRISLQDMSMELAEIWNRKVRTRNSVLPTELVTIWDTMAKISNQNWLLGFGKEIRSNSINIIFITFTIQ